MLRWRHGETVQASLRGRVLRWHSEQVVPHHDAGHGAAGGKKFKSAGVAGAIGREQGLNLSNDSLEEYLRQGVEEGAFARVAVAVVTGGATGAGTWRCTSGGCGAA